MRRDLAFECRASLVVRLDLAVDQPVDERDQLGIIYPAVELGWIELRAIPELSMQEFEDAFLGIGLRELARCHDATDDGVEPCSCK